MHSAAAQYCFTSCKMSLMGIQALMRLISVTNRWHPQKFVSPQMLLILSAFPHSKLL